MQQIRKLPLRTSLHSLISRPPSLSIKVNLALFFDINRAYAALGYSLTNNLRTQTGYMQQTKNDWNKGQLQLSLHQAW